MYSSGSTIRRCSSIPVLILVLVLTAYLESAYSYTTDPDLVMKRTISRRIAFPGSEVEVGLELKNSSSSELRGFYLSDHLPSSLTIIEGSERISIDGRLVTNCSKEVGKEGEIYPASFPVRWTIETPPEFRENNPIAPGSRLLISYSIRIPSDAKLGSSFSFSGYHWLCKGLGPSFGYEDSPPKILIIRQDQLVSPSKGGVVGCKGAPGTNLIFPPGAAQEEIIVFLELARALTTAQQEDISKNKDVAPESTPIISLDFAIAYSSMPDQRIEDFTFQKPITFEIYIDPIKLYGQDLRTLSAFQWDGTRWVKIGGKWDETKSVISGEVNRTGRIAVLVAPSAPMPIYEVKVFPNPFRPRLGVPYGGAVTISFSVGIPVDLAELKIYSLTGALIRTIHEEIKGSKVSISWDGRDRSGRVVSSGVYIYRIKVGNVKHTGLIVLAR